MPKLTRIPVTVPSLGESTWAVHNETPVFGLRVHRLSRVVSGRLLRGFEVQVHCYDLDNHAFWCSTDLLSTAHEVLRFLEACVSEYRGQPTPVDRSESQCIPNPYGGWLW